MWSPASKHKPSGWSIPTCSFCGKRQDEVGLLIAEAGSELFWKDEFAAGEKRGTLHDVAEFADVAGPMIIGEAVAHGR